MRDSGPPVEAAGASRTSAKLWAALIPMMLGVLLGSLGTSMLTTALPVLSDDLALDDLSRLWVIAIYPLAVGATVIVSARLGDALGRRRTMIIGLAVYSLMCLLGGYSQSGGLLILSRLVAGVAEALVIASVVGTIGAIYDARGRLIAYGMWTTAFGAGSALGPVVGGLLSAGPGWRWLLLGSAPVGLLTLLLALALVPESASEKRPEWDGWSIAASILGLGAVSYALQTASASPLVAAAVGLLGVVALVGFVRRQRQLARTEREPFLALRFFGLPGFSTATVRIAVGTGAIAASVILLSLHLQESRGQDAVSVGLALMPQAIAIVAGGVLLPFVSKLLPPRPLTALTLALQGLAVLWLATDPDQTAVPLAIAGFGFGIATALAATALFDHTDYSDAGQVGAIQETSFALGSGLGVAVFGALSVAAATVIGAPGGYAVAMVTAGVTVLATALLPLLRHPVRR